MRPVIVLCLLIFGGCLQVKLHLCNKIICGESEYTILWTNGTVKDCLNCDTCHPGFGLYPVCGKQITFPAKDIGCRPCSSTTFSDKLDSAPCHNCQRCVINEIVAANCTSTSDRNCSGTCVKGYYFAKKPLHNCQMCSYCCFDGKDEIQQECINQGLNATNQHCSHRVDRNCVPKPTSMATHKSTINPLTATHKSTINRSTALHSQPSTNASASSHRDHPSNARHGIITAATLGVVGGLLLAVLGVILYINRKKIHTWRERHGPQPDTEGEMNETTESLPESTAVENDSHIYNQVQAVGHMPRVQALQNAGFAPSSNSSTPQASPGGTPYHTDDEVEDLPDVKVRSKRLWKRQNSNETQRAPNDGAGESLLGAKIQAASTSTSGSFESGNNEEQQGNKGAEEIGQQRRRSSGSLRLVTETLKRKLSLSAKDDYQPLAGEDPDEAPESLRIEEHPTSQETKEGSTVEFKCKVQGKKKVLYQWLKDGAEIQGQNSCTLVLDSVKLRDFGCYACEVRYADSQLGSECVESSPAELDVTPCDGMRCKLLSEVSFETQERVQKLLVKKITGLGGWKQVAFKYKMDPLDVGSLEGTQEAGQSVISHLNGKHPELTVYDFCKTLKEPNIRRLDIVKELLAHLSTPAGVTHIV